MKAHSGFLCFELFVFDMADIQYLKKNIHFLLKFSSDRIFHFPLASCLCPLFSPEKA